MSGYAICFGVCFVCKQLFGFNPLTVPSTPSDVHPTREPICESCMRRVNRVRAEKGLPPHPIPPDAYEPVAAGAV